MLSPSNALTATWRGILALIIAAALWQIASWYVAEAALVPDLPTLLSSIVGLYVEATFWKHVWTSVERFLTAYAAAAIIGIPVGLVLGRTRSIRLVLGSLVSGLAVTPLVTLAPLTALWFGIGNGSKVSLAIICAVFPLMNKIMTGFASTKAHPSPDTAREPAQSRPPDVAKYIVAGLRVAIVPAVAAVVVAEMVGSAIGMGFMLMSAAAMIHVPWIVAIFLVLSLPVIALVNIHRSIEVRLASAS